MNLFKGVNLCRVLEAWYCENDKTPALSYLQNFSQLSYGVLLLFTPALYVLGSCCLRNQLQYRSPKVREAGRQGLPASSQAQLIR